MYFLFYTHRDSKDIDGAIGIKMSELESWEFNVWKYSEEELLNVVFKMFDQAGCLKSCNIDSDKFIKFLEAVKANYLDNPYHNFRHATDVTQFIYKLVSDQVLEEKLTKEQIFALMLSSLGHDISHPGKNSSYQKMLLTEIYQKFGENSTLERYHLEVLLTLIHDPEFEILKNLDEKTLDPFIKKLVLSTDMSLHKDLLQKIQNGTISQESKYGILVIKCADLAQLIRNEIISEKWVLALHKEQYMQMTDEIQRGMYTGPDEEDFQFEQMCKQKTFVKNFALPLYKELGQAFPELAYLKDRLHTSFIQ